jgi:TolB protein
MLKNVELRLLMLCLTPCLLFGQARSLGVFDEHTDVGIVSHPGSVDYDAVQKSSTVAGSGENMWFATDAFQFVWKKVSGDVTLTADVSFLGEGKEAHRKAVLMIRQSLDADSAYADVARHGDGLTSLQFREEKGAITSEVQSAISGPARLRIAKQGDRFYMSLSAAGEQPRFAGGSVRVTMHDPFYVGIGVCSHNKDVLEKAEFSNVELTTGSTSAQTVLYSALETVPLSGDRRVVYITPGRITSPQWTPDGVPETAPSNSAPAAPDCGPNCFARLSPDGQQLAVLTSAAGQDAVLRVLSLIDNKVRVLAKGTIEVPSWSPDSRRLAFVSYHLVPQTAEP